MKKSLFVLLDFSTKLIALVLALFALRGSCTSKERTDIAYVALREAFQEDVNRIDRQSEKQQDEQTKVRESLAALTEAVSALKGRRADLSRTIHRMNAAAEDLAPTVALSEPEPPPVELESDLQQLPKSLDMLVEQRAAAE